MKVKISRRIVIAISIYAFALNTARAQSPSLPNGLAPWEISDNNDTYHPAGYKVPPATDVRASAEWEEIDALVVTWDTYISIIRDIIKYAREECKVYVVCNDSNIVKDNLILHEIPLENIFYVQTDFNSVWCRDYGQWNVYQHYADSLYLIDWIYNRPRPADDKIPEAISGFTNIPIYQTVEYPYKLVSTGGNFMTDGWGTGFSSKLILAANQGGGMTIEPQNEDSVDMVMKEFMGINRYIKMEELPFDEIHHIDMHMKLLDEETLLVGEYPEGVADGPQIEENLHYILDNYNSVFGTPYKVVRIPMPPNNAGNYPDEGGNYRTYTNCVFINKTILVPVYDEQYDTTGLRILRENLPGYKVIGINCNAIIGALGALHCITKEVAASRPLVITHQPLHDTDNSTDNYQVDAWIAYNSNIGINYAEIAYTTDTLLAWNYAAMTLTDSAALTYTSFIPAQAKGSTIYYYIHAMANDLKQQVRPITAPTGFWSFKVGEFPSAVINAAQKNMIRVYPNPANDFITVQFDQQLSGETSITIFALSGAIIKSQSIVDRSAEISIKDIPAGNYILRVNDERTITSFKILKL